MRFGLPSELQSDGESFGDHSGLTKASVAGLKLVGLVTRCVDSPFGKNGRPGEVFLPDLMELLVGFWLVCLFDLLN